MCIKFKIAFRKLHIITSSTPLPQHYIDVTSDHDFKTYGDLAFAWMSYRYNNEFAAEFEELLEMGLDKDNLERLV